MSFLSRLFRRHPVQPTPNYCQMCGKREATPYKDPPAVRFFCSKNCEDSYYKSMASAIFLSSTRVNLETGARSQVGTSTETARAEGVKRYCWSCGKEHVMSDKTCTSCGKFLDGLKA